MGIINNYYLWFSHSVERNGDSDMPAKKILIFGLGYVGQHLAHALSAKGWNIIGTTRSPEKLKGLIPEEWCILKFEDAMPVVNLRKYLAECSHLITTIPSLSGYDPVLKNHKEDVEDFFGWTGYVSATSVYPDQEDGFIDESAAANPATQRGRYRLAAEQQWQAVCAAEIFRVAGIYGPHRNALVAFREGRERIIKYEGQLSNRIHQSDITKIIIAAISKPRRKRIINLCDDEPASQGDVVRFAAQLLGVNPPKPVPLEDANLTPMAKTFYTSRRRLRSNIVGPELGVQLDYPTYREGLRALFEQL